MSFYEEMAETTLAMIAEFGQPLPCRSTSGAFDKVRGGMVNGITREQTITAIRVPVNQTVVDQLDERQEGETLRVSEVIMLKVAAADLEFDIALGQVVEIDGRDMPIVAMTKVRPTDVTLLYTVALRK
ncbi:MAG: hypothetical protein WA154_10865 [Moraxellaceae bacterium]